jgi:hypothetical protein
MGYRRVEDSKLKVEGFLRLGFVGMLELFNFNVQQTILNFQCSNKNIFNSYNLKNDGRFKKRCCKRCN